MPRHPFEAPFEELVANPEEYIDAVFSTLRSSFLELPKGPGFVEYPDFQTAYEVLKRHTRNFEVLNPAIIWDALREDALAFLVLRTILGFTPSELAYVVSTETGVEVTQGFARTLDREVRENRKFFASAGSAARERAEAMIAVACGLVAEGAPSAPDGVVHRLDKVDTKNGPSNLGVLAQVGVPYSMLLYERFLGRPFAGHRDSVSELVGDAMETAVEEQLATSGVSYRKTKRAEKIEGFDQAPDFVVPDEWALVAVIEAKLTEDDGTARDKVTRVQHLAEISRARQASGQQPFEVIACVDGRGFGVRRNDMLKLLMATKGKVFSLSTIGYLVDHTSLADLRSKR